MEKPSEEQLRQINLMKKMLLRKGLSPEARERLGRVKSANPELAEQAENLCIQLIQQGQAVSDAVLVKILERLRPKKDIRIRRV